MSDGMIIRSYVEDDEPAVVDLWHEAFPDAPPWNDPVSNIRRKLPIQPELFLVGELNRRIVATAMAGFDGHRGWVYYVAVAKDCRRRKLGRAIMTEIEYRLRSFGVPKLNLQVRSTNRDVIAFYESLGFTIEDRVSMGKRLT